MFGKTGEIQLTIGNLPPQVSRKALKAHVQSVINELGESRFRLTPAICSCTILRLTHPETGVTVHRGLVSIQPAKLAFRVMTALQQAPLRGHRLRVRRYRHGSFPVNSSVPLTSMSELLRVGTAERPAEAAPMKLDLVSNTGRHSTAPTQRMTSYPPSSEPDSAFAH